MEMQMPDLTQTSAALIALAVFAVAYVFVIAEEFTHLRKSKPVVLAAGILWLLVALAWQKSGLHGADEALRHNLVEYGGLLLFLLAAMTFVNTLDERQVFAVLRSGLVARGFSFRAMFWLTGAITFVLSPILDNLTTALVMGAVVLAVGPGNAALHHAGLHQHRRGRECGRRIQPLRRHHDIDGVAEGLGRICGILRALHPVTGELADPGDFHELRHSGGTAATG